jgi:hypothetical protein
MQVLRGRQTFRLEHPSMRDQHLVPGRGKLLDDRASDESRPAQDDNPHASYLPDVAL